MRNRHLVRQVLLDALDVPGSHDRDNLLAVRRQNLVGNELVSFIDQHLLDTGSLPPEFFEQRVQGVLLLELLDLFLGEGLVHLEQGQQHRIQ